MVIYGKLLYLKCLFLQNPLSFLKQTANGVCNIYNYWTNIDQCSRINWGKKNV